MFGVRFGFFLGLGIVLNSVLGLFCVFWVLLAVFFWFFWWRLRGRRVEVGVLFEVVGVRLW